jgi:hypothetical protein
MTSPLLEIKLSEDGPTILVECTASEGSQAYTDAAAADGLVLKAQKTLVDAISAIPSLADALLLRVKSMSVPPKAAVIEFGIKFGAKGNVIIAGGEASANCKITLNWNFSAQEAEGAPAS